MMRRTTHLLLALSLSTLLAGTASAQCTANNGIGLPVADNMRVTGDLTGFREAAIAKWEGACSGSGSSYPDLDVSGPFDLDVLVIFHDNARDDVSTLNGCEQATVHTSNGVMTGGRIDVWDARRDGSPCNASVTDLIAHGLGHILGFNDVTSSNCDGTVMGRPIPGQALQWQPAHCTFLRGAWWTTQEVEDAEECTGPEGQSGMCHGQEGSPILLDLDRDGFRLSGLDDPVLFDVNADGVPEVTTWTGRHRPDAFLVLDRNGNGLIDDGSELFGDNTPLLDGTTALNGYVPLAELDTPFLEGNADGFLDITDPMFAELQVWIDVNHDGISQPSELSSLESTGVVRLALGYWTSRKQDQHGNNFRYISRAWVEERGRLRSIFTTDVFFIFAP